MPGLLTGIRIHLKSATVSEVLYTKLEFIYLDFGYSFVKPRAGLELAM